MSKQLGKSLIKLSIVTAVMMAALTFALPGLGVQKVYADGEICFTTIDATTVYSSTNSAAVRDAVTAASSGDVIKIAGNCVGVDTGNLVSISGLTLTLQGAYTHTNWNAQGAYTTTLDANDAGRVIYLAAGQVITVADLTVTGGYNAVASTTGGGGGIYNNGSNLTLTGVTVTGNRTSAENSDGGGYL